MTVYKEKYMKLINKILISILSIVLLVLVGFSVFYSTSLQKNLDSKKLEGDIPKYHFVAIVYDLEGAYWNDLKTSLEETCVKHKIAIEMITIRGELYQETLKYFDIAIESKVEGIIVPGYNTKEFRELVEKAFQNGIPVVTIDSDAVKTKRVNFVGIDDMELGREAARQVRITSRTKIGKVALLINGQAKGNENVNNIIKGFKEEVGDDPNIKLVKVQYHNDNVIGVRDSLLKLFKSQPEINTLVCTSSVATLGVTQSVVEQNKVGYFNIIGYEDDEKVLQYIAKGVVVSSLVPDAVKIGQGSVESLINVKDMGYSLPQTYQKIKVINKYNVEDYIAHSHQIRKGEGAKNANH